MYYSVGKWSSVVYRMRKLDLVVLFKQMKMKFFITTYFKAVVHYGVELYYIVL